MAKTYSRPSKAPEAHRKYVSKVQKAESRGTKMPKMSRREMLILYYKDRGFRVISGNTSKYVTMEKTGDPQKRFIGKNGGVRVGIKISDSWGQTIDYEHLPAMVEAILKRGK